MGTSTNNNSNYLHNQAQISKFGPFSVNDYFAKPLKSYTSSCARAQYDQMTTPNSTFKLQLLNQLHTLTRIYLSCCCLFLTNWL